MKRAVLFGLGVMFAGGCDDDGVRVNEPVELDILEHVVAAAAGSAHALNVHVAGVTPDSVRYRSADSSVARVDGRVVTGVAPGVAWVHAYVETRTSVRDSVAVIVTAQPLAAGPLLRVSPATVSLYNGKRRIVRVTTDTTLARLTAFHSSAPAVARVDATGTVTGVSPGTAIIHAHLSAVPSVRDSAVVVVGGPAPACPLALTITPAVDTIAVGGQVQYGVFGCFDEITAEYMFRSFHPAIATVDERGLARGVTGGNAILQAISRQDSTMRVAAALTVR